MSSAPVFLSALTRLFQEGHALVFWNDAGGEFAPQVDGIAIDGVKVLRLDRTPALQAKIAIEREAGVRWLVYAPFDEPEPAQDWLLDARLRGKPFSADTASIQLEELGLSTRSLRDHLRARAKYLRARDRFERVKRWVQPTDTADDLDRKMIGGRGAGRDGRCLGHPAEGVCRPGGRRRRPGRAAQAAGRVGRLRPGAAFWALVEREFGYSETGDEAPTLRGLLYRLFATDFCSSTHSTPAALAHFVIAARAKAAHAAVFASRWRTDMANYASYDTLSGWVADELKIAGILGPMAAEGWSTR